MVLLVLEREALSDAVKLARQSGCSVWAGSDAIGSEEHQHLVREGVKITRFSYPLANRTPKVLADALATIEEHHPVEIVWVQHDPLPDLPR